MNTYRGSNDVMPSSGASLRVPSGFEVESATLHMPVGSPTVPSVSDMHGSGSSGLKEKLAGWKSTGLDKVGAMRSTCMTKMNTMKTSVSDTMTNMKSSMSMKMTSARDGMKTGVDKVQTHMRSNTGMWTGIAAGAGLVLGLTGRVARHRAHVRNRMPDLIIIEAAC